LSEALLLKLTPFTVRVKASPPAMTCSGSSVLSVTLTAGLIVKVVALETPPPGGGLKIVRLAVPGLFRSLAGMVAVSCVALTNVVGRALPFHRTTAPLTNPLP
jgi:hypothetical protein